MLDQNGRTVTRRRGGRLRQLSMPERDRRVYRRMERAERRVERLMFAGPFRQGAKVKGGVADGMWQVLSARGVEVGVAVSRKEAREQAKRLNGAQG